MATKDRMIGLLPYYLRSGENIGKYYAALAEMFDEVISVFAEIINSRDIDNAYGFALDIIGDIVSQLRNIKDDDIYRNRIKTKVIQNNSRGYIEDINQLGSLFLGENYIGVKEGWNDPMVGNEPAMLEVELSGSTIESVRIDEIKSTLQCGTVALGANISLGTGIQSVSEQSVVKTYKPIFIPELKLAAAVGVRFQYRMKNAEENLKIKERSNITFKNIKQNLIMQENSKLTFKSNLETLKIVSGISYAIQRRIQCGTNMISATMGILL